MEEGKKKERGIYLRKDGHWEARYSIGRAAQGKTKYESIYGWSKEEVAKKLSNMGLRYAYNREEPGRIKFSPFPPAETAEAPFMLSAMSFVHAAWQRVPELSTRENCVDFCPI